MPKSPGNHRHSLQEEATSIERITNGQIMGYEYSSMVFIKRKNYWLSWSFVTPSQRDLDDAVNTVQHISFDNSSPRQQ